MVFADANLVKKICITACDVENLVLMVEIFFLIFLNEVLCDTTKMTNFALSFLPTSKFEKFFLKNFYGAKVKKMSE